MDYKARFLNIDLDVLDLRPARARAEHWKRRAGQEAVNRSGACIGGKKCDCPNCREHMSVWKRTWQLVRHDPYLSAERAFQIACQEATRGAAPTPWTNPT